MYNIYRVITELKKGMLLKDVRKHLNMTNACFYNIIKKLVEHKLIKTECSTGQTNNKRVTYVHPYLNQDFLDKLRFLNTKLDNGKHKF